MTIKTYETLYDPYLNSYDSLLNQMGESNEVSANNITGGVFGATSDTTGIEFGANKSTGYTYIQSRNFVSGSAGWQLLSDGSMEAKSITLTGGTIRYGKTSFADSTNAGYYMGAEGIYYGSAADATKLKYTIADGSFDLVGTISGRATATLASAIDSSGHFIDAVLDTSAKTILGDFTFSPSDYSGAFKTGTITWNTTTGAITGGTGIVINKLGIIGALLGVTKFSITTAGDATFAGTLSAATGSLGVITTGLITLDTSGYIRGGQTAYNTGIGFFLGYSTDAYKFSIGNPEGHYLTWDGSDIVGKFNIKSYDTWITGQELSAGDYVFISDDSATQISIKKWFNNGTSNAWPDCGHFGTATGGKKCAQSFTVAGSGTYNLTAIRLKIGNTGAGNPDNFKVTIQAGADNPDGTELIGTGWLSYTNANPNPPGYTYLTFTEAVTLTAGTKYWIVAEGAGSSDTNYYDMYYISAAHYNSGWANYDGSNWTTGTNVNYLFELFGNTGVGRAYKASAIAAATYDSRFGFVVAASNYGATTDIQHSGIYTTTGLTAGTYYLKDETLTDNDVGKIGTVAGSNSVVVGTAYNTTKLKIKEL